MKKSLTIGWKLLIAFGVVAGLSATSALVGWLSFDETRDVQSQMTSVTIPELNKVRTIAQSSRLLVATTPKLVESKTQSRRREETNKLLELTSNLRDELANSSSSTSLKTINLSIQRLIANVDQLDRLVGQRIDSQVSFQQETAMVLEDIAAFVGTSEALVSNASATASTRIADLSRMIDGDHAEDDILATLDELIDLDIDHMELMFEMRHRVAVLGLLVEQNRKATSVQEIERLRGQYLKNIKIVKRRSDEVRDPNRKELLERYIQTLAPHADKTELSNLFNLRQNILTSQTSISAVLRTNEDLTADMQQNVDRMLRLAEMKMSNALRESERKMQHSYLLMLLIAVFSIGGAIPIMWFYVRNRVVKRVNKLSETTHTIVEGDLDISIDTSGDDELSEMAHALEVFRTNAIEKLKTEAELREHKEHLEAIVDKRTKQLSAEAEQHALARAEAEQANQVKSAFLASMSHEIRTPITSILGTLHLFDESRIRPATKQRLDVIRASSETLLSIINDILDYSKIEADCIEIDNVAFDLFDLVNDLQLILAPIAERKDIALLFIPNLPSGACYRGDPGHIRQVLINVLGNAVKFTEAGKVIFTFNENEQGVVFEIEDTGPGIPAEEQEHLFDDFFQSSQTKHLSTGGTGLGLTICRRLIDEMGGEIMVRSELGEGSLFSIFVPLKRLEGAQSEECQKNRQSSVLVVQPLKILLVEDNAVNQEITLSFLQNEGHHVDAVFTGGDAISKVSLYCYDLILMDVSLPDIDGLEATRRIRLDKNGQTVPIIAISAHVFKEEVEQYLQSGMNGFLAKPFSPRQLSKAIDIALKGDEVTIESRIMLDQGVMDVSVLQEDLPILGADRVKKLIDAFLKKVDADLKEMQATDDLSDLASRAHSLKSAAGSLGLTRLFQLSKAMEMSAKSGDLEQAMFHLSSLPTEVSKSKEALQSFQSDIS